MRGTTTETNRGSHVVSKDEDLTTELQHGVESLSLSSNNRNANIPNRSHFEVKDIIKHIWSGLDLPEHVLDSVHLPGTSQALPSSFKVEHLAQASIALSALATALVDSVYSNTAQIKAVTVPLHHAAVEFASEQVYILNDKPSPSSWGSIGGLHKTADGHVRIHDSFINHRKAALSLLGCEEGATREEVASKILGWKSLELEKAAQHHKAVIYALRSFEEWDATPQAKAIADFPITLRQTAECEAGLSPNIPTDADRCLRGLRVLEISRVIAAPVAGRTLAAHGADVLWVTSPNLPALPGIDIDVSRGKRTIQLDLDNEDDRATMKRLAKDADVFIQSYRPGALANKGFSPQDLVALCPHGIIYANLSAWGSEGPWSGERGFDSMVQTVSGLNVSEADHFGEGAAARPLPVQALDHAAGYLLATGILAAVYKQTRQGGSWEVNVSLAAVGKYLRSLGQIPGRKGFECINLKDHEHAAEFLEERECGFGVLRAVRHAADVEGKTPGWEHMPKKLGSDEAQWLEPGFTYPVPSDSRQPSYQAVS